MSIKPGRRITRKELVEWYVERGWTREDAWQQLDPHVEDEDDITGRFNDCNDEL